MELLAAQLLGTLGQQLLGVEAEVKPLLLRRLPAVQAAQAQALTAATAAQEHLALGRRRVMALGVVAEPEALTVLVARAETALLLQSWHQLLAVAVAVTAGVLTAQTALLLRGVMVAITQVGLAAQRPTAARAHLAEAAAVIQAQATVVLAARVLTSPTLWVVQAEKAVRVRPLQ